MNKEIRQWVKSQGIRLSRRLNLDNVATLYSAKINIGAFVEGSYDLLQYGWYKNGRAFVAKNGSLMLYDEAYNTLVPKNCFNLSSSFYVSTTRYAKSMTGIVRYLIDKYNSK